MFSSSISITAACGAGLLPLGYDQGVLGGLLYNGKSSFAQLVTNIAEIVITNWVTFGFTYVPNSPVSWRFPLGFQCVFALVTIALVQISPESPRWFTMKNPISEAEEVVAFLIAKPRDDPVVVNETQALVRSVNHEAEVQQADVWKEIFTRNSKQQTLWRMLLGAGIPFFPLCRKKLMLWGALMCSISFALVAVGLCYSGEGSTSNKGMSIMAVVFIFVYYIFYGLLFLSIPYMYPAEISSQKMSNVGTSFATTVNWTFVYLVVVVTPTAINNIQWKYYMLYAIFDSCFIPIIYNCYIETTGLSLEQIGRLFEIKHEGGRYMSWSQATALARAETTQDIGAQANKDNAVPEHCETIDII